MCISAGRVMRFRPICREHLLPKVCLLSPLYRFFISQWRLAKMELRFRFQRKTEVDLFKDRNHGYCHFEYFYICHLKGNQSICVHIYVVTHVYLRLSFHVRVSRCEEALSCNIT